MITKTITVKCANGLDARPIALLVQQASQYVSQVHIQLNEKKINAKSIMGMMSLSLVDGEQLDIVTNGDDEDIAAEGLAVFFSTLK